MSSLSEIVIAVLAQVSIISIVALIAITALRDRSAQRHSIALIALSIMFLTPVFAAWLSPGWIARQFHRTDKAQIAAPAESHVTAVLTTPTAIASDRAVLQQARSTDEQPIHMTNVARQATSATSTLVTPNAATAMPPPVSTMAEAGNAALILRITLCIWGVGMLALFLRQGWRRRSLRVIRISLSPLSESELDPRVIATVQQRLSVSRLPKIMGSDVMPTPAVLGVVHPVVVMPRSILSSRSNSELADILTHECAHILRGDPWSHLFQQFVGTIYWFHPLVQSVSRALTQSREELCDNHVLQESAPTDYAETLLALTEHCTAKQPVPGLLGLLVGRWSLESRVTSLLDPHRRLHTRSGPISSTICLFGLLGICLLVGGAAATAQGPADKTTGDSIATDTDIATESRMKRSAAVDTSAAESGISDAMQETDLAGVCLDEEKNAPLAGVKVTVWRYPSPDSTPVKVASATTKEDGAFRFTAVPIRTDYRSANGTPEIVVSATAAMYSSTWQSLFDDHRRMTLRMSSKTGTLSGTIRDESGKPVRDATVTRQHMHPLIEQLQTSVTDRNGHFEIQNVPTINTRLVSGKGVVPYSAYWFFEVRHPTFGHARPAFTEIPQHVDFTFRTPVTLRGTVTDLVTGRRLPNALVWATSVGWQTAIKTRTDKSGRWELHVQPDHYDIYSQSTGRVPLAISAFEAVSGDAIDDLEIRMLQGAIITGTVRNSSGTAVNPVTGRPIRVGVRGPATPSISASTGSVLVKPDGSFRLRVAPGQNYLYLMSDGNSSAWVTAGDGDEIQQDLIVGTPADQNRYGEKQRRLQFASKRRRLQRDLMQRAMKQLHVTSPKSSTAELLEQLRQQNTGPERFGDEWAQTLRQLIVSGSESVPVLIAELDTTSDDMMLRCLGFVLRGIGDQRAVPALIRALPKTLMPSGSDMGLVIKNDHGLEKFMYEHDLDPADEGVNYNFGRPVREICGALQSLTNQSFGETSLYHIFRHGTKHQRHLKRALFHRVAVQWQEWWEQHWSDFTADSKFSRVNLPRFSAPVPTSDQLDQPHSVERGMSGAILSPIDQQDAGSRHSMVAFDLDTGRSTALPKQFQETPVSESQRDKIIDWAISEGYDILGDHYEDDAGRKFGAIRSLNLQAWQLNDPAMSRVAGVLLADLQEHGKEVTDAKLVPRDDSNDPSLRTMTRTFFYITSEGTPGLLEVGVEVTDDSLQPGETSRGNPNLKPLGFRKGRRFGYTNLVPTNE